jgi:hypothetical protein
VKIKDVDQYWEFPPPEPSEQCAKWVERIRSGWRPNRRIRMMGYHESAAWFGVYIWEYLHVLYPLLLE